MQTFLLLGLGYQAWAAIVITLGVFITALATKIPSYCIFMGAMTLLMITGILSPKDAIAGFSNLAVVTEGVLCVVIIGMEKAGLMHWLVEHLLKTPKTYKRALVSIMTPASLLSSFLSNTSVVAILINVVRIWCCKMKISPSRMLIPLSYAAGAGGAFTLIGSPSTLIIADLYQQSTGKTLGFFAPFVPAMICFLTCMATVMLLRRLLPDRNLADIESLDTSNMQMKLTVPADSPFVMRTVAESGLKTFGGGKLVELKHFDDVRFAPIPDDEPIFGGDTLYFSGGISKIETEDVKVGKQTIWSAIILIAMVGLTLAGVFPLLVSCLLAAAAMVICNCCTLKEGFSGIHWEVMIVWAGSIAIGLALDRTGVADALAREVVSISGNSPLVILFSICFIGSFLTEFVSNTAASALLFPVVLGIITPLGLPVFPYTLALIISVTCSFATPIGSPTHMMVYGPGGYTFTDFLKIGLPMNFIILTVNALSIYFLFLA